MPLIFPNDGKLHSGQMPNRYAGALRISLFGALGNRQDLFTWKDDFSISLKNTPKMVSFGPEREDEEQGQEAGGLWGAAVIDGNLVLQCRHVAWSSPTWNQVVDTILKGVLLGRQRELKKRDQ